VAMRNRGIIVVGASAGGLQALQKLVGGLPADLPAAMFVVMHIAADSPGLLPAILNRSGPLSAAFAVDGEAFQPGRIYVAPPDHHLFLKAGWMRVSRGPKENGFRPAVDPLFRTAAQVYGPRVIGVILSGALDDGTYGLKLIKQQCGVAVVQHPEEALTPSMPLSAIQNVEVDHILTAAKMPPLIASLVEKSLREIPAMPDPNTIPEDVVEAGIDTLQQQSPNGKPTPYTCPECGGTLAQLMGDGPIRFRCHVGHGFTAQILLAEQSNGLEAALWGAVRTLDEAADLRRRVAEQMRQSQAHQIAQKYEQQAREAEQHSADIRQILLSDKMSQSELTDAPIASHPPAGGPVGS
jgi:two-component system, chemotaxis family, protein-glutamate methylesterase/glutaminase